jgi:asparagine synthase (glutamine-hydrolysing)
MCGIGAIFSKKKEDLNNIKTMMSCVSHRGPDSEKILKGNLDDKYWTLGHKRLSIIDLSNKASQPMEYENYLIIFNGEIYNYLEIKDVLIKKNIKFKSNSDTEVLLKAYYFWGDKCLDKFLGMFSFIILNKKDGSVFAARDRFGVKPLYYITDNKTYIYFASEIKQFFYTSKFKFELNHKIVKDFLILDKINHVNDQSFFQNIQVVPASYFLKFNINKINKLVLKKYYTIDENSKKKKDIKNIFIDALKIRLRSDRKVGVSLSGGLDSSLITIAIKKIFKKKLETFSACFKNFEYDESKYVSLITNKFNLKNTKIYPKYSDLKQNLEKVLYYQDEPFGSFSILSQWLVMKEASKKGIKVILGGQGADEVLGGYKKYTFLSLIDLLKNLKFFTFIIEIFYLIFRFDRRLFNFNHAEKYLKVIFKNIYKQKDDFFLKKYKNTRLDRIKFELNTFRKNDILKYSLPSLLRYEDRNAMAHSIESRLPFLDNRLVENVLSDKSFLPLYRGKLKFKFFIKFKEIFPKEILYRKNKVGFEAPDNEWLKKGYYLILYSSIKKCKYLKDKINQKYLEDVVGELKIGNFKNASTFIRIGIFSLWYNQIFNILNEKK